MRTLPHTASDQPPATAVVSLRPPVVARALLRRAPRPAETPPPGGVFQFGAPAPDLAALAFTRSSISRDTWSMVKLAGTWLGG